MIVVVTIEVEACPWVVLDLEVSGGPHHLISSIIDRMDIMGIMDRMRNDEILTKWGFSSLSLATSLEMETQTMDWKNVVLAWQLK